MKIFMILSLLVLISVGMLSCGRDAPTPKAEEGNVSGWYTVRAGNTLSSISILFYGEGQYSYFLEDLNVEMGNLENASLSIGDRLYIPSAKQNYPLLTRTNEAGTTPEATRLNPFLKVENLSTLILAVYFRSKCLPSNYMLH